MPRGDYLGEFEQMVLLSVARLGDRAYGMAILDELYERAGVHASVGSVYAALDRLRRNGYVRSELGEPTSARGGRAKRYFLLERAGAEALQRARTVMEALWDGLDLAGREWA